MPPVDIRVLVGLALILSVHLAQRRSMHQIVNMCMFLRLFLFVWLDSQADANAGDFNASILLMVSTSARFNSSGAVNAVEFALERIREDESVLKGLTLQVSNVTDSKVH